MQTVLLIILVLDALALVGVILIQQGKGADAGAAFGSGASATVFGAQGSASFLTRTTAILATIFFICSLGLAILSGQNQVRESVTEVVETTQAVPAEPDATSADDVPVVPAAPADVPNAE